MLFLRVYLSSPNVLMRLAMRDFGSRILMKNLAKVERFAAVKHTLCVCGENRKKCATIPVLFSLHFCPKKNFFQGIILLKFFENDLRKRNNVLTCNIKTNKTFQNNEGS